MQSDFSWAPKEVSKCESKYRFPRGADGRSLGRAVGRSVGRCTVTWLPSFLGWVDLLSYGAPPAERARAAPLQLQCKMIGPVHVRFMLFSFFVVNVAVSAASEYMIFTQKLSTVWIQSPYTSIHRSPAEIGAKSFILSWPSRITQVVVTLFYMIFLAWFKWLICKFRTPCFC